MVRGSYLLVVGLAAIFHLSTPTAWARFSERPIASLKGSLLPMSSGLQLFGAVGASPQANTNATAPASQTAPRPTKAAAIAEKPSRDGQAAPPGDVQLAYHVAAPQPTPPVVHTDYKKAMDEAAASRKMLLIYFYEPRVTAAGKAFETLTLSQLEIQEKLKRYVVARLPVDAQITVDGNPLLLLAHPAFAEMLRRPGVAIVDLAHERAEYFGHVVSTFPFTPGKYYNKKALSLILDLPPGTLTQRTMIFAVRIHPEAPGSAEGQFHNVLASEASSHAYHQASIQLQGHHSWESRFHRINAKLPGDVLAQEVCAESWPDENLVEACVDCVDSWRQSPGHWSAVRRRHPLFGFDIKRGRNGIWYATGIFGLRRR